MYACTQLTEPRMQKELDMNASNNGYSITSLVFFVTYTIFQIPATVMIRKLGPRLFLAGIVTLWGAVMIVSSMASKRLKPTPFANNPYLRVSALSRIGNPWLAYVQSSVL